MEFGNVNTDAIESIGNIDIEDAEVWEEPRTMLKDADMKNHRKSYGKSLRRFRFQRLNFMASERAET